MPTEAEPAGAAPMPPDADGYLLRRPRPRDVEELGALHCAVWQATYRRQLDPETRASLAPETFAARWRERLATPPPVGLTALVAVAGMRLAGVGVVGAAREASPPAALELRTLDLLPAHHGTGLADELLRALLGRAAAYLWVVAGNDRAVAFCWRHGFRPDGVERLHSTGMRQVRMVRAEQLTPPRR